MIKYFLPTSIFLTSIETIQRFLPSDSPSFSIKRSFGGGYFELRALNTFAFAMLKLKWNWMKRDFIIQISAVFSWALNRAPRVGDVKADTTFWLSLVTKLYGALIYFLLNVDVSTETKELDIRKKPKIIKTFINRWKWFSLFDHTYIDCYWFNTKYYFQMNGWWKCWSEWTVLIQHEEYNE